MNVIKDVIFECTILHQIKKTVGYLETQGQQILTMLIEEYKDCTNILDMESPDQICENSEQRKRRCAFYLRNGFRKTGIGKSFEGVDYTILMKGDGTFTLQDYDQVIEELRSYWDAMPEEE